MWRAYVHQSARLYRFRFGRRCRCGGLAQRLGVDREECLRLLTEFVQSGDIHQGATAAGMILGYLATLEGWEAQLTALDDLRRTLTSEFEQAGVSGSAEERHVAVEDALEITMSAVVGRQRLRH